MRKTGFKIDTFPGLTLNGYTNDEDWNGWACPYFTFEQSGKIVEAHKNIGQRAWFDEENDGFVFEIGDDMEFYKAVKNNGHRLYPLGNGSWIWEESDDE
jgi:hypothetical protein